MKEYGSDFHYLHPLHSEHATHLTDVYHDAVMLADGRQCIVELIRQHGWERLWMPEYFCYEVIESIIRDTGISIVYYYDEPTFIGEQQVIESLPFENGDALLRMNYFGLRKHRSNRSIPVPVIEDHSHNLLSQWALHSDADWCIASLRKTLPIPEGGMLWSPKGLRFNQTSRPTAKNQAMAEIRWEAMHLKADYLHGNIENKEEFRQKFLQTEEWFDHAETSLIDKESKSYIENLDIGAWQQAKLENWKMLQQMSETEFLCPEDETCVPFSFVMLTKDEKERNHIRKKLIESALYPAILWDVPNTVSRKARDFSRRMLSIHCDARYTESDIQNIRNIISKAISS